MSSNQEEDTGNSVAQALFHYGSRLNYLEYGEFESQVILIQIIHLLILIPVPTLVMYWRRDRPNMKQRNRVKTTMLMNWKLIRKLLIVNMTYLDDSADELESLEHRPNDEPEYDLENLSQVEVGAYYPSRKCLQVPLY